MPKPDWYSFQQEMVNLDSLKRERLHEFLTMPRPQSVHEYVPALYDELIGRVRARLARLDEDEAAKRRKEETERNDRHHADLLAQNERQNSAILDQTTIHQRDSLTQDKELHAALLKQNETQHAAVLKQQKELHESSHRLTSDEGKKNRTLAIIAAIVSVAAAIIAAWTGRSAYQQAESSAAQAEAAAIQARLAVVQLNELQSSQKGRASPSEPTPQNIPDKPPSQSAQSQPPAESATPAPSKKEDLPPAPQQAAPATSEPKNPKS